MSIFAYKGEQVWNTERTDGYEFTQDIEANTLPRPSQVKALGGAPAPQPNEPMPGWFADIVISPGGMNKYREQTK